VIDIAAVTIEVTLRALLVKVLLITHAIYKTTIEIFNNKAHSK